jgi:hypothetical protein
MSAGVVYSPFLTSPILGCSSRGLTVDISAQPLHAQVGERITYTYRLTNTGQIPLTVAAATDSHFGALDELQHTYAPLESAVVTRTHRADSSDPATLVNTLSVTARPSDAAAGNEFTRSATVMVAVTGTVEITGGLGKLGLALSLSPNISEARLGDLITYTVQVSNTGEVALQNVKITDTVLGVHLNIGALAVGAKAQRTYAHTVNANDVQAGEIDNTVIATAVDSASRGIERSAGAHVTILPDQEGGFPNRLNLPLLEKRE